MRRFIALMCACLIPGMASATGLVENDALVYLSNFDVQISLTDTTATVVEARSYNAVVGGEQVFYKTLADGATDAKVSINGIPIAGELLTGEAADAKRRALVLQLMDPAPLRDLGLPLYVVTIAAALGDSPDEPAMYVGMQVVVETTLDLAERGSMSGTTVCVDWVRQPLGNMSVTVTASTDKPLRALFSPFHELSVTRDGDRAAMATYSGWGQSSTHDLSVLLSTGDEPIKLDLLPFRYADKEGGHVLALITPETTPAETGVAPRDIAIVLDRSGSMHGTKLAQAKTALAEVLGRLAPQDAFAMVTFDDQIESLDETAMAATPENLAAAQDYVAEVWDRDGGTNIYDALKQAFNALPKSSGGTRYVVMMTDGIPTAGNTDVEEILAMARQFNEVNAKLMLFGIGDDVNTVLLEKLASDSGGDVFYIRPGLSVEDAITAFFENLEAPVLGDVSLDLSDFGVGDAYPETMPDLFAGKTAAVLMTYSKPGIGQARVVGTRAGQPLEHGFEVALPSYGVREGYVPRLWATRHVGALLHQVKLNGIDPTEALETARRYGIVTEFTFYEADEDGNVDMTYSAVPTQASGSKAVETSAALDEYEDSNGVSSQAIAQARWNSDRVFLARGGYLTDTYIDWDPSWVNVHFGSEAYFELALAQAKWGMGGFLSVAQNVQFELMGTTYRITDPEASPLEPMPAETTPLPGPIEPLSIGATLVNPLEVIEPVIEENPDNPPAGDSALPGEPMGCTSAQGTSSPGTTGLLMVMMLAFGALFTRRRQHT